MVVVSTADVIAVVGIVMGVVIGGWLVVGAASGIHFE